MNLPMTHSGVHHCTRLLSSDMHGHGNASIDWGGCVAMAVDGATVLHLAAGMRAHRQKKKSAAVTVLRRSIVHNIVSIGTIP